MRVQAGNDDARSVLYLEWNLLDALATVLVLCTNGQAVGTIVDPAGSRSTVVIAPAMAKDACCDGATRISEHAPFRSA